MTMHEPNERDKSLRASAAQFFVASELCRRGFVASVTMGNTPNTDILVTDRDGTRFAHVQVKTFVPGNTTCSVGLKAEHDYGDNFFWVLAGIPHPESEREYECYIITASEMAGGVSKGHKRWLETLGKKGQQRKDSKVRTVYLPPHKHPITEWSIAECKERWDLIGKKLQSH
jgi:hypothetical protein